MTQMVEFDLAKILENMEQKLDRVLEAQIRLEGKVETLQVEVRNVKEDVNELKTHLSTFKAETKENFKETRNDVSGLYKWVLGLILTAVIGFGTIFFRIFDLFPNP